MRRICLDLEYEGTRYHGWQVQPNAITIQQVLEETLTRILGERIRIVGAGRTDAGVHAWSQIAHFSTERLLECRSLLMAMNSLLPEDIVVRMVEEVPSAFHARKSALKKRYEYWIQNDRFASVFSRRFAWHIKKPLDVDSMRKAARHFMGTHEFSSFQASGGEAGDRPVRMVSLVELDLFPERYMRFSVEANGFLRHMVRILVGTLAEVGTGRIHEQRIPEILLSRDRRQAGRTAPAKGLFLKWVQYPEGLKTVSNRARLSGESGDHQAGNLPEPGRSQDVSHPWVPVHFGPDGHEKLKPFKSVQIQRKKRTSPMKNQGI